MNVMSANHHKNDENLKSKLHINGHDIDFKLNSQSSQHNGSHTIDHINEFNESVTTVNAVINNQLLNTSSRLTQLISSSKFNSRRKAANLLKILNEHQQKQQNFILHTSATQMHQKNDKRPLAVESPGKQQQNYTKQSQVGPSVPAKLFSQMPVKSEFANNQASGQKSSHHKHKYNLWDDQLYADVIPINCNSIVAELHKKKFGSGGKGKCIHFDSKWMTPIEFEQFCGKGNCRDWKRTLKAGGQPLISLLDDNILMCHAVSCACAACSDDATVVGPIRPFTRYRRRKRDEILAQNAFKKFLSLKPPTLIGDQLLGRIDTAKGTSGCNSNNSSTFMKTIDDTSSNQGLSMSPANSQNEYNDSSEFDEPFSSSYREIEIAEQKQWTLLEQAASVLITQAQNLKDIIEQAKSQSKLAKQMLIDELRQMNGTYLNGTSHTNEYQQYDDDDDENDNDDENDDCEHFDDDNDDGLGDNNNHNVTGELAGPTPSKLRKKSNQQANGDLEINEYE